MQKFLQPITELVVGLKLPNVPALLLAVINKRNWWNYLKGGLYSQFTSGKAGNKSLLFAFLHPLDLNTSMYFPSSPVSVSPCPAAPFSSQFPNLICPFSATD